MKKIKSLFKGKKNKEANVSQEEVEENDKKVLRLGKKKNKDDKNVERLNFINKIGLTGFEIPTRPKDRGYQCDARAGSEYPFKSYILDFGNTSLTTGELDSLYRAGAVNISFHLSKLTRKQAVDKYKRAVTDEGSRVIQARKAGNELEEKEAEKALANAERLLDEISDGYNDGFLGTMVVTMFAEDDKTLDTMGMLIQDTVEHNEHNLRALYNRQRDGWLSTLPLSNNKLTDNVDRRFVDRTAIVATSPFYSSKIPFTGGVPVGENRHTHNMEFLNVFAPYLDNYSSLIVGASGSGKSFSNKFITSSQVLLGYRIFSIDPDGENGPICTLIGGKEVEVREGGNCTINVCALTEEEIETTLPNGAKANKTVVPIGAKVGQLIKFYNKLMDGMNKEEKAIIKQAIMNVIKKWEITEDPESLYESEKRPVRQSNGDVVYKRQRKPEFTLSDIYQELLKATTKGYNLEDYSYDEIVDVEAKSLLRVLRGYLRDTPEGMLFDGQTEFNGERIENLFDDICWVNFNIKAVEGSDVYDIVMHVLTQLGWEYFIKRPSLRKYRKRLKIEEAWRMKRIEGGMQYVEENARRSRKYNAGIDIITQDLQPFLDDPDGVAVVKNATSSLFLRIGSIEEDEKKRYKSIFGLSEGELEIICREPAEYENDHSKGEGVLRVGGSSAFTKVKVSEQMRAFIDTDPEYLMKNGLMPTEELNKNDIKEQEPNKSLNQETTSDEEKEVVPT